VLDDLKTRSILLGSMVATLAALIGWVLSVGITSRLRKLSVAAEHVAATGELDIDTPLSGRDEAARLGRSFKEMLAALARSKEQQQRLVEDAGHELRTPLTSLRTNLDVLKRHPNIDSEARQQILLDIDRDTAELAALVEEVVTLAVDRHTDELAQPIEMKGLATAVAARAARRSGRNIVVTGDTSIVVARRHLVDRAISNLLDNAVKFDTSNNDIEVSISGGKIIVGDRGPGIPESEIDLIFERFHRAVASRTLPGSGLGLAIVADVARSHGGDVVARNREGGGAEIGFFLPAAEKQAE
jgi:two-component system sensor histidine kinase MprB